MRSACCRSYLKILVSLAFQAAITLGQDFPSTTEAAAVTPLTVPETELRVKVSSTLVELYVTVTDKHNRVVNSLRKNSFVVYDEGVEQTIAHFGFEEAPVSVCLVFDASWSMSTKLQKEIEAAKHLLDGVRSDDEYCLVRFSDRPQVVAELSEHTTGQIRQFINATKVGGATALLDAILPAMSEVGHAANRHKALVLISDGDDNNSRHTEDQVEKAIRERDIQIYAIALPPGYGGGVRGYRLMQRLSEQSGGQAFQIDTVKELPNAVRKIGRAIRHQYVLGYYPTGLRRDGKYRRVTITLRPCDNPYGLHAFWRPGYYESGR